MSSTGVNKSCKEQEEMSKTITDKKLTVEQIQEAIHFWESKLQEMQKAQNISESTETADDKQVTEEEWLSADDLTETENVDEMDVSTPISGYEPNTVGALIAVLKRTCKMTDLILPRANPEKKEMMVFDIYSSNGRAVIDLVPGRIDDPAQI